LTRNILTVPVQRVEAEAVTPVQDLIAVEEPLEIRIGTTTVSITMRTPGHDLELAAGFLFTESILTSRDQIRSLAQESNSVTVELNPEVEVDLSRLERHFYTSSSCGVCGKASIEALRASNCPVIARDVPLFSAARIHQLPDRLRQAQAVFDRTGGLHAAALFDLEGNLLSLREDVGRHNALDKLVGGEMLAARAPCSSRLLFVSGRTSFELVQKTVMAGIPILAAVGAPSSLAVEAAQRFGITLVGFVRNHRFNIYSGAQRIQ
jgi:FdhD protein